MESGRKPADDRVLPHDKTARCVMIGLRRLQLILMGADSMRFVVYRQSHGDRNALPPGRGPDPEFLVTGHPVTSRG